MDDEDEFGGDLAGFGMDMNFEMPDFSSIGRTMKMLSWLPAIISSVTVFILSFLAQVIYNGIVQPDYNITYGEFMWIILLSLIISLVVGILVKVAVGKKQSSFAF
jgi:hypothetical protein